jgi:hypothetical protein
MPQISGASWNFTSEIIGANINVERCTGATCTNFAPLFQESLYVSTVTDSVVTHGVTYRYRVRTAYYPTFNGGYYGYYSNIVTVTAP